MNIEDIKKKLNIVKSKEISPDVKGYLEDLTKDDWIKMNVILGGESLGANLAIRIANGEYILEATIEDHNHVQRLKDLLILMKTLKGMQEEISINTLQKFYSALSQEPWQYRKSTPVLFHLNHTPVLPLEIEENMKELFTDLYKFEGADPVRVATILHDELMRIYPFDKYNEEIARAAMEYYLFIHHFPICPITLTEQEYNLALEQYFIKGRDDVIYENLINNINGRLELILQGI